MWSCAAIGKTYMVRSVSLQPGFGASTEQAEARVKYSYVCARHGYRTAEKYLHDRLEQLPPH